MFDSVKASVVFIASRFLDHSGLARRLTIGVFCALLSLMSSRGLASPAFASGASQGIVSITELREASGVIASRNNSEVLWTHNDSGDSARIFAIDTHGRKLGIYNLPGAVNVDYEDIAMGPGPVTNVLYIYVGDIGDNTSIRANITIYQIPEPAVYGRQYLSPVTANLKGVRAITLTYPDGSHNAEALFVDPWTGDLFIATKQSGTSGIYSVSKAQLDAGNPSVLTFVRSVIFDVVSGADISPSGTEIVFRQEDFARLWKRSPGQSISSALGGVPVSIPVVGQPTETNGEAISFDSFGSGYYTLSDSSATQPLYYFARTSADGPKPPQVLVAAGSAWKYFDHGADPGLAWRNPGFNDSAWASGAGRFGYGNGDEQTVISYGPNPNDRYVTTYFRATFTMDNAPCISNATLKLLVDDGAAVFLNGQPAAYFQVAPGAGFTTLAANAQSVNLEDTWFSFPIDPALLINGTNTLAVEIHQASTNSTNLRFDAQLLAMDSGATRITSESFLGNQFQLSLCGPKGSNETIQASSDFVNWTDRGGLTLTNGAGVFRDTDSTNWPWRFYRARR